MNDVNTGGDGVFSNFAYFLSKNFEVVPLGRMFIDVQSRLAG